MKRAALCMVLTACAGTAARPTVPENREAPPPTPAECPANTEIGTPTITAGEAELTIVARLCGEQVVVTVPYGLQAGEHKLVSGEVLREALHAAVQRDIPPVDEWSDAASEYGRVQPLAGDWLYVGNGEPAMLGTSVDLQDTERAEVLLARIQAVFGASPIPLFITDEWEGEKPSLVVIAADDPEVFGTRILRAYLGEGDAYLDGVAQSLWQFLLMKEERLTEAMFLEDWLALYTQHRRSLNGDQHRQSPLAGRVMAICLWPRVEDRESDAHFQAQTPLQWLDRRGVIDVRECLADIGVELAAVRYEDATPERLLRVRSAPGDPPTVERGGSFFQAGDVIIEVNRHRIRTRGDVAWALRGVDTGDRFTIVVRRNDQEARTWARRPRVGERNAVRFTLISLEADES